MRPYPLPRRCEEPIVHYRATKQSKRMSFPRKRESKKKGAATMWPFTLRKLIEPREHYIWAQVHILHETKKAILVYNGMKIWIPKSRIRGIRLRNNIFEIYIREGMLG